MSEPQTIPNHVHPEMALLPWYANGTLSDTERHRVAEHLNTCATCRAELEELIGLKADLMEIYASQPGPSAKTAQSILNAVAQETAARRSAQSGSDSFVDGIDQWIRFLFMPRWVPTLAATILVAQGGILLWTSIPATQQEQVTTRGLNAPTARLNVMFQAAATADQIQSILQTVRGRIVDGPNPNGLYIIEILATDTETSRKKLELLRGRTDIISSANLAAP